MQFEQVIYEKRDDGVAIITLNRPERLNAFTRQMIDEWYAALQDAHLDANVRVIVVTGAGRAFCAGADVGSGAAGALMDRSRDLVENRNFLRDSIQRIPRLLAQMDKPYIAAVNGVAVGAGMDMASLADIRFASTTARFGMTYVRMGIIPGDGGCWLLPRIVGMAKALELIWTGEIIDAEEALRIGYVNKVLPPDELMPYTLEFAQRLARGPAVAIQLSKRLAYRGQFTDLDEALEAAQAAMIIAQMTEDAREGPRAFLEKREPQFKGR
ncbi:MAG: enoyl-CoA hydratase-related protein [Dehalococcoidia bacterium]|nr:enoyl-CoA hydratase-related protein [Dehalococcoidia bacterium]MDW8009690.1 enoyl-CoA hydratase-related protein [Chloroflexota bacterium]